MLLATLALGVITPGASGQTPAETALPLVQVESGHYVLETRIGAQGPYDFIFDTGANRSALLAPLAVELGLLTEDERIAILHSLLGSTEAPVREIPEIDFGAGPVGPLYAALVLLGPDGRFDAEGLLGADAFAGRVITADFAVPALRLDVPPIAEADAADIFRIDSFDLLRARALVDGVPADVILDTGSPRSIANRALADRLQDRRTEASAQVADVVEADDRIAILTTSEISIGSLCRRDIAVLAADVAIFDTLGLAEAPALIIGLDVLENARLTIDRPAGLFRIDAVSTACIRS